MGFQASVSSFVDTEEGEVVVKVESDAEGLLIGRRGQTLDAVEHLVNRMVLSGDNAAESRVAIDVGGYRQRRRDTLLELAEHPKIVAVKDSTGDFQSISRLIAESPDGFEVYSGDDWATFGYACLGAVGVVSVASHLVGPQIHQMLDLIRTGDIPAARKIHETLTPLFNALFVTSNPIPLKAALEMLGICSERMRLPMVPLDEGQREVVRSALEAVGLEVIA